MATEYLRISHPISTQAYFCSHLGLDDGIGQNKAYQTRPIEDWTMGLDEIRHTNPAQSICIKVKARNIGCSGIEDKLNFPVTWREKE